MVFVKVGFVTANYPPEAAGGTEQVVVALARELRARGVQVAAISGSDVAHTGDDWCLETFEDVDVLRVFTKASEFDHTEFVRPRLLAALRQWLLAQQPDVVHIHSFFGLGLGITGVCRELGVPVVVTFHDLWTTCARFFRLPKGSVTCPTGTDRTPCVTCIAATLPMDQTLILAGLLRRDELVATELAAADVCTAPSQTAARAVASSLPLTGAIEVVPHGLLREIPSEHAAEQPASGALRIGTFGGLVPEKGLRELVDACVAVVAAGHACELHLSGPWYDDLFAEQLRQLATNGGLTLVERGRYSQLDRHPARDLHLAVFPSKCQETYGLVVEEALAHRVPVVVSNFGALAERSITPGVVVTEHDALAKVLTELVAFPERLSALRAAIPQQLPTIAVSAQRHLDIYESLR
ncbi:MAG: glycosyltransferase involved in cell wall biosynthesis [Hyphomicrobiaceae bacterium]